MKHIHVTNKIIDFSNILLLLCFAALSYWSIDSAFNVGYVDIKPVSQVVISNDDNRTLYENTPGKIYKVCPGDVVEIKQAFTRTRPMLLYTERTLRTVSGEEFITSTVFKNIGPDRIGKTSATAQFVIPHSFQINTPAILFVKVTYSFTFNPISRFFPKVKRFQSIEIDVKTHEDCKLKKQRTPDETR